MRNPPTLIESLSGIYSNLCPRCRQGHVFKWISWMRDRCSVCDYSFSRESGYFLGAVLVGYIVAAFSTVPTLVLGIWYFQAELFPTLFAAGAQVILLTPFLSRISRLIWIYLDYRTDEILRSKNDSDRTLPTDPGN